MKEVTYEIEEKFLSPYAAKSADAGGRVRPISPCPIRTDYQRDRDRIIHSKSFRRLKHKTQVFLSPEGDHYRTRLTHTLEVSQIARTISRALRLNEDLTEAIALGHDLGHTPFGHAGERTLNKLTGHFTHNEQSLRVVEVLEEDGMGLNLTELVRDGILNHTSKGNPKTLEGKVVSLSDRIAYINHDIDDAIRAGLLSEKDLPSDITETLGDSKGRRINTLVYDIVSYSMGKNFVSMSPAVSEAASALREFMFERLYISGSAKAEEYKADKMLVMIFNEYMEHTELLSDFYKRLLEKYDKETVICDLVASMTDTYAVMEFQKLFIPAKWKQL
ncbi:MAG: deoxyguanosinetriphosphate triphosphohydrolase [Christensenellales bacterium]